MKESVLTETDWNITGSFGQQKYMQKKQDYYKIWKQVHNQHQRERRWNMKS